MAQIVHLADRSPQVTPDQLLSGFHPSYRFGTVSFDTYIPDPAHPSQAQAVERLRRFAADLGRGGSGGGFLGGLFGGMKRAAGPAGIYLDGGFGVGKTHLLASTWHAAPGPKAFGTFVEYTNLVGALSFRKAVDQLKEYTLVCIDEFELDDPGDTVLMSRLMRELADAGVRLVATSNTLPGSLGEGRFAAQNFPDAGVLAVDDFDALTAMLSRVHPSRYRELVKDVDVLALHDVKTITEQATALRFVVFADRLYDKDVPVLASGVPFDALFTQEMMHGGYMKKYFRTVSRMTALVREGQTGVAEHK